jgi:putative ABC transport system permease protein
VKDIVPIEWPRLALTALTLLVLLGIGRRFRLGISRLALVSSARGSVQLIAVGYVLAAVFAVQRPEIVAAIVLVMVAAAAQASGSRLTPLPGLALLAGVALGVGTGLGVLFMAAVVVRPTPWYDPQYVIPITGMLLGNAMNGASLAGERFQGELVSRRSEVEARLALGLTGAESVHPLLARALRAALLPTMNSFAVAGVVQLPGMMTGQILAGVHPSIAVRYQILILFLLMACTAITTLLFLRLMSARYLTPAHQLRSDLLRVKMRTTSLGYSKQNKNKSDT